MSFAAPLLALAATVTFGLLDEREGAAGADGEQAPDFVLPITDGDQVALDDVLAEGDTLTYFSMRVDCDGCSTQIPEIDQALADRDIEMVPVMVDRADQVAHEAQRFEIELPILIDDRALSRAYGMLGQYGHGDRPPHSLALIGSDGRIEQTIHYATTLGSLQQLLADLELT